MKSVFISFDISRLLIITETTIDRKLGTDYVKWIFDKKPNFDFHFDAFLQQFYWNNVLLISLFFNFCEFVLILKYYLIN
jgi:hypothetical protein